MRASHSITSITSMSESLGMLTAARLALVSSMHTAASRDQCLLIDVYGWKSVPSEIVSISLESQDHFCAVAALSTKISTAALDKHPQSKERGITLDLGFSSFTVPMPARLSTALPCRELQFTLVDCPGHASLIRTIIGGAQIIDMMLLVIDVTKGIQVCLPKHMT